MVIKNSKRFVKSFSHDCPISDSTSDRCLVSWSRAKLSSFNKLTKSIKSRKCIAIYDSMALDSLYSYTGTVFHSNDPKQRRIA